MSETSQELPTVIVGAGITGLTLAYRLTQAGRRVMVLEANDRAGGNIRTFEHDGFLYDRGPDSFLRSKPAGEELCRDLGLQDQIITPEPGAHLVQVAHRGRLHPMPEGLSLGVPKRPGPLLSTPLLSLPAKLRALLEPFIPAKQDEAEETIHDFLSRRMGTETAERLAAPLLAGVFAGDARRLSMHAAFPQLVEAEKRHGSLFSGMNGGKSVLQVLREPLVKPASPFMSLSRGLGSLIQALVDALPKGVLRLSTEVKALEKSENSMNVVLEGERLSAAKVIVAGPPWSAGAILSSIDEGLAHDLAQVRAFSTATVFFGLEKDHPALSGSGFIVPPGEGKILASTFVSSKWSGRAPKGTSLVRAFVGGARTDITGMSDDDLVEVGRREFTRLLGDLGPEFFTRVFRYEKGSPQPELGFRKLLQRVDRAINRHPCLSLIGSGLDGAGIPDCIRQANELAQQMLETESRR